jgi:hypothetical protein
MLRALEMVIVESVDKNVRERQNSKPVSSGKMVLSSVLLDYNNETINMEQRRPNKNWETLDGPHGCYSERGGEEYRELDG